MQKMEGGETARGLIESLFQTHPVLTRTDASKLTGIPRTTCVYHLESLSRRRYVHRISTPKIPLYVHSTTPYDPVVRTQRALALQLASTGQADRLVHPARRAAAFFIAMRQVARQEDVEHHLSKVLEIPNPRIVRDALRDLVRQGLVATTQQEGHKTFIWFGPPAHAGPTWAEFSRRQGPHNSRNQFGACS